MYKSSSLGKIIKNLRNTLDITQIELSRDICSQAEISRIENGHSIPYSDTLFLIAERLGIDVNYFYDHTKTPRLDYIIDTFSTIRDLVHQKNTMKWRESSTES